MLSGAPGRQAVSWHYERVMPIIAARRSRPVSVTRQTCELWRYVRHNKVEAFLRAPVANLALFDKNLEAISPALRHSVHADLN